MTTSGDKNYDELFALMVSQEFPEGLNPRERIDPGILRVLDEAAQLETTLNRSGVVDSRKLQEAITALNQSWDSLHVETEPCRITGKLRATEYAEDDGEVASLVGEPPFQGISGRDEDSEGYFYTANGFSSMALGFRAENTNPEGQDASYRVVLQLALHEDYSDQEVWFTIHPSEVEYIEPTQPSTEGTEAFIGDHFPDLLAAIKRLPNDCGDDEQIRQALDDFVATIDFSRVDLDMGAEEILDTIERFITSHLSFDNSAYTLNIDGVIHGLRMNHEHVPREYRGALTQCLIGNVRLFPTRDEPIPEGPVTYRAALEAWYPVPERGGGRTPIYIPIDSLRGITAQRPSEDTYPFSEDTFLVPNDEAEGMFDRVPLAAGGESGQIEHPSNDDEAPSPEQSHEALLQAYQDALQQLYESVSATWFTKRYSSKEAALAARNGAAAEIDTFLTTWDIATSLNIDVQVKGESVAYSNPNFNITGPSATQWNLEISDIHATNDNPLVSSRGRLFARAIGYKEDEVSGGYALRGVLVFSYVTNLPSVSTTDDTYGIPILEVETRRYFLVELNNDAQFELPELLAIKSRQEAFDVVNTLPETIQQSLNTELINLQTAVVNEVPSEYTDYTEIDGLRGLASQVVGDANTAWKVAEAIEYMLGRGRVMRMTGPIWTTDGTPVQIHKHPVEVVAILGEHPHLPDPEPILVMNTVVMGDASNLAPQEAYIPIRRLEWLGL